MKLTKQTGKQLLMSLLLAYILTFLLLLFLALLLYKAGLQEKAARATLQLFMRWLPLWRASLPEKSCRTEGFSGDFWRERRISVFSQPFLFFSESRKQVGYAPFLPPFFSAAVAGCLVEC